MMQQTSEVKAESAAQERRILVELESRTTDIDGRLGGLAASVDGPRRTPRPPQQNDPTVRRPEPRRRDQTRRRIRPPSRSNADPQRLADRRIRPGRTCVGRAEERLRHAALGPRRTAKAAGRQLDCRQQSPGEAFPLCRVRSACIDLIIRSAILAAGWGCWWRRLPR